MNRGGALLGLPGSIGPGPWSANKPLSGFFLFQSRPPAGVLACHGCGWSFVQPPFICYAGFASRAMIRYRGPRSPAVSTARQVASYDRGIKIYRFLAKVVSE